MTAPPPITLRPIERPAFDNRCLPWLAWFLANRTTLCEYFEQLTAACPEGERFAYWCVLQHEVEVAREQKILKRMP